MAETTATAEAPRHQSGGLAVALAKLDLDALTVADAVADVAAMAGENVTTAIRADLKEFRAETNARLDTLTSETNARFAETNARLDTFASETNARLDTFAGETNARLDTLTSETNARLDTLTSTIQSQQREMATIRWLIGIGFTLLGLLLAFSTFRPGGGN